MLQQYRFSYWTKNFKRISMTIYTDSLLEAKAHAESMPDFNGFCDYPYLVMD